VSVKVCGAPVARVYRLGPKTGVIPCADAKVVHTIMANATTKPVSGFFLISLSFLRFQRFFPTADESPSVMRGLLRNGPSLAVLIFPVRTPKTESG
jgi:hypothetical protein